MSVFPFTFSGTLFSSGQHQTCTCLARSSSALLVSTIWNCAAPPLLKSAALKSWKPTVFDHVRTPQLITARVNTSATWKLTWHVCCNGSACGRHDHTFLHKPSLTRCDIVLPQTSAQILQIVEQLSKNPHMHCTSYHVGWPQPTSVCLAQIPFQSNWLNTDISYGCKAHTCRLIGAWRISLHWLLYALLCSAHVHRTLRCFHPDLSHHYARMHEHEFIGAWYSGSHRLLLDIFC